MIKAPIPPDEAKRIASIKRMQLIATPSEETFDRITRTAQRVFDTPIAFISIVADKYLWLKSMVGLSNELAPRDLAPCGHVIYDKQTLVLEDAQQDERFFDNDFVCNNMDIRFYAGRPLFNAEGFVVGTLCLIDHQPRKMTQDERETFDAIGYWVESVFAARGLSKAMDQLLSDLDEARRVSMMDSLLQIWNRGAIEDILSREADQAKRQKNCISILMIDIDHFKEVNDIYGHHVGDVALLEVVKALRHELRSYDSLGRYGGEEFLVILPNTLQADAIKLAERLRLSVERSTIHNESYELHCTISIGVAVADFSQLTPDIQQVAISADQALLQAKANGRNRIELAS